MVWQQSAQGRFGDISSVGPRRGRSSLVVGLTSTYFAEDCGLTFVSAFGIILMLVFYFTYVRSMTANAA